MAEYCSLVVGQSVGAGLAYGVQAVHPLCLRHVSGCSCGMQLVYKCYMPYSKWHAQGYESGDEHCILQLRKQDFSIFSKHKHCNKHILTNRSTGNYNCNTMLLCNSVCNTLEARATTIRKKRRITKLQCMKAGLETATVRCYQGILLTNKHSRCSKRKTSILIQRFSKLFRYVSSLQNTVQLTRTYSYTRPAKPRYSGDKSSKELTATPPHARVSRSMFRRFARRRARIPAFDNISSDRGSMPCTCEAQMLNSVCVNLHLRDRRTDCPSVS